MGAVNEGCWTCHPVESIEGHRISLCTERRCTTTRYRHPVWRGWRFYLKKKRKNALRDVVVASSLASRIIGWQSIHRVFRGLFFRRFLILSIRSIKSLKICCVRTACFRWWSRVKVGKEFILNFEFTVYLLQILPW